MKKVLYMIVLIIGAILLGRIIGNAVSASGSASWLASTINIDIQPGTFINFEVLTVTFGMHLELSTIQIFLMLVCFFIYYKTAPKLFGG